jgi:chromosome partitioning protein
MICFQHRLYISGGVGRMIVTIGNMKGGVGKSTIACNLAVALTLERGHGEVVIIDGDAQGSAATFTQARAERMGRDPGFACVRAQGREVSTLAPLLSQKFEHVLIDAGGQDNPSLRAGLIASDAVLVPVTPRSFEAWALDAMAGLIEDARAVNNRLTARTVINLAFSRGSDNADAQALVREDYPSLVLMETLLVQRKVYSDRAGQGLSVLEGRPVNAQAAAEFRAFVTETGLAPALQGAA